MRPDSSLPWNRRQFVQATSWLASTAMLGNTARFAAAVEPTDKTAEKSPDDDGPSDRPLLTKADAFRDVSRGTPKPHTLTGDALVQARLTPETWRLEITTAPPANPMQKEFATAAKTFSSENENALDLPALFELGKKHEVRFLKAMQCLNLPSPLGQGLWEGVPLRNVLQLCGSLKNVRRIYYWGFHNNDPKQRFQSSLNYTQAMETPPGELPPFLAYRLNGEPIPLTRGGPVRMVIPWAHGFKSIKWLQNIVLTNDFQANDTYAEQNNDPESYLKTAAYFLEVPAEIKSGEPLRIDGIAVAGLSGLKRVEYSLKSADAKGEAAAEKWLDCELQAPPRDWTHQLPNGISSRTVLGFDSKTGQPLQWPLRYSMVGWTAKIPPVTAGNYELRVRAVDLNDFAQPEPRPIQKSGRNAIEQKELVAK